ncbi:hypothetical protein Tco_1281641 [Tanacetum coccineum]
MSSSTVTYTSISSDYKEPSDVGSPGVVVYRYDRLHMHPVDPYVEAALQAPKHVPLTSDYVPGPEDSPSPDYVPGPEEPEQAPLSPDYMMLYLRPYPADGGDDADDELFDDDDDDDVEEDEEEEEEEHLASVDSFVVPVVDHVPSAEDTEAFETDDSAPTPIPSPRHRLARMFVRHQIPMSDTAKALITEYDSAPTPPSPLSPLSSPLSQIPSPPLPLPSPPTTSPTYAKAPLGYRAVWIRLRAASPSTHHPLEIPSPPLLLPSTTHRDDLPKAEMSLRKRARFTAPIGRFEIRESSSTAAARQVGHTLAHTVDCGFIDTMDASIRAAESRAMTAVGWSMTELQILLLLRGMMLRRFICVVRTDMCLITHIFYLQK